MTQHPQSGADETPLVEVMIGRRLDGEAAAWLRDALADALTLRPEQLVVDLTRCPSVSAVAVEVLLDAHVRAKRAGVRLVVRAPSRRSLCLIRSSGVRHVMDVTGAGTSAVARPAGYVPRHARGRASREAS